MLLKYSGHSISRNVFFSKSGERYTGRSIENLLSSVYDLCGRFREWGLKKGDRAAIISDNRFEWAVFDFACMFSGLISVPLYPSLEVSQIRYIINDSGSRVCFVSGKHLLDKIISISGELNELHEIVCFFPVSEIPAIPNLRLHSFENIVRLSNPESMGIVINELNALSADVDENDVLTIIYTSGTTGVPKGVMLTHKNLYSNVESCRKVLPITEEDNFLSYLPYSHSYERTAGYYLALFSGSRIFYAQNIETLTSQMPEVKPTIMMTVPRLLDKIYNRLLRSSDDMPSGLKKKLFENAVSMALERTVSKSSLKWKIADALVYSKIREKTGGRLRFFVSGGGALNKNIGEFFEYIGIRTLEGYGLTETSPVISVNPLEKNKYGTVGPPLYGVSVRLSDENEILVKGDLLMKGYYKDEVSTAAIIKDGWLFTGDIGEIDEDGYIRITDRKKSLFKTSGGKYVAPGPLEDLIMTLPYAESAMVTGDGRMYVTALIVPQRNELLIFAAKNGVHFNEYEDLFGNARLHELIQKDIDRVQKSISGYERVRKFTLIREPFSIEGGELTPTLKVKRKFVEKKYSDEIGKMYLNV
ncbi:MAG: long-chain fatty acid--CoA ligase [Ignavibacteria bacterium]|nr:long-chain fatty acid--CoA ligase [Ignavibacteria bacterium]